MTEASQERSHLVSIGELSTQYGVSPRTLRFYEEKGILRPVRISGRRFYTPKDVIRLKLIRVGSRFGFTLHEVKKLIDAHVGANKNDPATFVGLLSPDAYLIHVEALQAKSARITSAIDDLKRFLDSRNVETAA